MQMVYQEAHITCAVLLRDTWEAQELFHTWAGACWHASCELLSISRADIHIAGDVPAKPIPLLHGFQNDICPLASRIFLRGQEMPPRPRGYAAGEPV